MRRTRKGSGAPEGARRASEGAPERPEGGRFSTRRKSEAVVRLLRGEDLDALSRELGVTPATLSFWREAFLAGGEAQLKSRPTDGHAEEVRRLKAKIGELAMANELLEEKIDRLEGPHPFVRRRSRQ